MSPTADAVVGFVASVLGIIAVAVALARWIRHQFAPIVAQLSPNGGSSAVDKVNDLQMKVEALHNQQDSNHAENKEAIHRVERHLDDQDRRLDRMDGRIDGIYKERKR